MQKSKEAMSFHNERILAAYAATTQATLATWRDYPDSGEPFVYPDDTRKLCISSGRKFTATGALAEIHAQLIALAAMGDTLDVVPVAGLHFSFLALSWGVWDKPAQAPDLRDIASTLTQHAGHIPFVISQLRLVPLKNALILAGVPDAQSFAARHAFAQTMLQSPWSGHIGARYRDYEIPPLFWHTTLARANTQFAPKHMRALYFAYSARMFDDLQLGPPQLALVNYNWSRWFLVIPDRSRA